VLRGWQEWWSARALARVRDRRAPAGERGPQL